jgi:hypothetical protein
MTKHGSELNTWLTGARAESQREVSASPDSHAAAAIMSDEAVDIMLEAATGAAASPMRHEFDLRRVTHEAALEAARDGECTPAEECEPPHHRLYGKEVTHPWAAEPSLDSVAELRIGILD